MKSSLSLQAFLMAAALTEAAAFVPFVAKQASNIHLRRTKIHQGSMTTSPLTESLEHRNVDNEAGDIVNGLSAYIGTDEGSEEAQVDAANMRLAIQMAQSAYVHLVNCTNVIMYHYSHVHPSNRRIHASGGERGSTSPFPKPLGGAVIVTQSGKVLGRGRSDYRQDAVLAALKDAGLEVTPLSEWVVAWPHSKQLRDDLATATLYLTLEPSNERQGEALPPMTQLIQQSGIQRVVIGSANPVPELRTEGAATLHSAGIQVTMGIQEADCSALIEQYADLANSKLQKSARKHFQRHGVVSNECTLRIHTYIRLGTISRKRVTDTDLILVF